MQNLNVSPSAAATELLERRKIRKSLSEWAKVNGYIPAAHHQLIIRELEAVARGECKRLAIFLPPGSAKSTYASTLFPSWYLAQRPDAALIMASNVAELAERFGRRVRNAIAEHGNTLGVHIARDDAAAGRWSTTAGGEFYAAGVGGTITGRRADLALIDDPIKSRAEADSELIRNRQWEWFLFDLQTRLKPNASIILIQTRWHENDLAGQILAAEGEKWRVIRIPMEAEDDDPLGRQPGERLWSSYFTTDQVEAAKRDPRVWSCLYQQNPTPDKGLFFAGEWLLTYQPKDLPSNLNIYAGSDHAVSEKEAADYTCCVPAGVCENGILWILPDVFWERAPADVAVKAIIDITRRRRPLIWGAEHGHISKAIGPFLRRQLLEANLHLRIEEIVSSSNKQTRANSISGRMAMGLVRFPGFAPWWPAARAELLKFPAGAHDDFVDALSEIGFLLDQMAVPIPPRRPNLQEQIDAIGGSWGSVPGASC
jgi:predicted phage terminase large subunit-like protein